MRVKHSFIAGVFLLPFALPAQAATMEDRELAVLRLLEKTTARVEKVEQPVGKPIRFGDLEINVESCQSTPPEEQPESTAYVDIAEVTEDKGRQQLFKGWMFASNPALNALENPIYDVWLIECKNIKPIDLSPLPAEDDENAAPAEEEEVETEEDSQD